MTLKQILAASVAAVALTSAAACAATRTQKTAGEHVDDAVVLSKVKTALIAEKATQAHDIDVEVFRGTVQLNGFVGTMDEKSKATLVASGVEGVQKVENNLVVSKGSGSVGGYVDDAAVTAKVKTALIQSAETKGRQINVETTKGVVHLSGFVDSEAAKAAATKVAGEVSGVKEVRNTISVKTTTG